MGSVYKRGRIFWIAYYRNNIQIRETTRTKNEGEARNMLRIREGDIARGLPITNKSLKLKFNELLADVVTDYTVNQRRSIPSLQARIRLHLAPYFGTVRATQIDTPGIKKYIAFRLEEKAAHASINRELGVIHRAFELGRQSLKVVVPPYVPKLKESNVRRGFFEVPAMEALCQYLPGYLIAPVRFAYMTGWRVSEIRQLQWRHVDFVAGEIVLDPGTTKNDDGRVFPMTQELRELLKAQAPAAREQAGETSFGVQTVHEFDVPTLTPFVFTRRLKTVNRIFPLGDFRKAWAKACFLAGLPVVVHFKRDDHGAPLVTQEGKRKGLPLIASIDAEAIFHDFRRTAVRNLVRRGIHERVAMAMTGHKTREVFDRYHIVSRGDLEDARRKLDEHSANTNRKAEG